MRALMGKLMIMLALASLSCTIAFADKSTVPAPEINTPMGKQCVDNPEWMRVNHMELLNHDRVSTMRQGIRQSAEGHNIKGSLKQCINCHVSKNTEGLYPSIDSREHFCKSCHAYVAVKLDCFECHTSKPEEVANK